MKQLDIRNIVLFQNQLELIKDFLFNKNQKFFFTFLAKLINVNTLESRPTTAVEFVDFLEMENLDKTALLDFLKNYADIAMDKVYINKDEETSKKLLKIFQRKLSN